MRAMVTVNVIRRAGMIAAAAAVAPVVALAASGCGSPAATRTGAAAAGTTNGLQNQTPDQVLSDAIAALRSANSVQIVWTPPPARGPFKIAAVQVQGDALIDIFAEHGQALFETGFVGKHAYIRLSREALKHGSMPDLFKHLVAGRWLRMRRVPAPPGNSGKSVLDSGAAFLGRHGPLAPAVRQAMLNGRKVVVITDRQNGAKLYVANTGRAYPLLATLPHGHRVEWTDYGAHFGIPTPANTLPGGPGYTGPPLT